MEALYTDFCWLVTLLYISFLAWIAVDDTLHAGARRDNSANRVWFFRETRQGHHAIKRKPETPQSVLLRPSLVPNADAETLLRPAGHDANTAPEQLLRAALPD